MSRLVIFLFLLIPVNITSLVFPVLLTLYLRPFDVMVSPFLTSLPEVLSLAGISGVLPVLVLLDGFCAGFGSPASPNSSCDIVNFIVIFFGLSMPLKFATPPDAWISSIAEPSHELTGSFVSKIPESFNADFGLLFLIVSLTPSTSISLYCIWHDLSGLLDAFPDATS